MDVKSWPPKEEAQLQLQPSFIQRCLSFHQRFVFPCIKRSFRNQDIYSGEDHKRAKKDSFMCMDSSLPSRNLTSTHLLIARQVLNSGSNISILKDGPREKK